ncbi:enoyl-CoA hydratase/isomerase family protein [Trinickia violacea]|uniref:Enoyl-CoA hydratase/isomerase family protein n=1 Tax=Trinickia violacea TaxID=2571746 RepID=A0A4P8IQW4_9BURK|nr:enoyl-CoA hydratase/isomerase family protein [Trinickia violacea]QCP50387.1 enoyl-CoA hydratase/isomerase family protein [Trinickia violacea]
MSNTDFATLELSAHEGVAHIRFTRPDLVNRFDDLAHEEFATALEIVTADENARALVISAEGRVFSAGGDFDEIIEARASAAMRQRMARNAKRVFGSLVNLHVPVVAAVQGAAAGMGATIVTLCDIVVAYRHAKIADPHVAVGIVAGDGGIIGWSQAIGVTRAKRFLLTGDAVTAEQGFAMGLVTDLADSAEDALPIAQGIAKRIAALPCAGVQGTKRAFARLTQQAALAAFDLGLAYEMESMTRLEVAEAIAKLRK